MYLKKNHLNELYNIYFIGQIYLQKSKINH